MHCLLCHEKIPRLRVWRTKSEFCCEEHAALYKKQTLERLLVDSNAPQGSMQAPLPEPPEPSEFEADESSATAPDESTVSSAAPDPAESVDWSEPAREESVELPPPADLEPGVGIDELWRLQDSIGAPSSSSNHPADQSAEEALAALRALSNRSPETTADEPKSRVFELPGSHQDVDSSIDEVFADERMLGSAEPAGIAEDPAGSPDEPTSEPPPAERPTHMREHPQDDSILDTLMADPLESWKQEQPEIEADTAEAVQRQAEEPASDNAPEAANLDESQEIDLEAPEPDWDFDDASSELSALKESLASSGSPPVSIEQSDESDVVDVSPVEPDWEELEALDLSDADIDPPEPVLDEEEPSNVVEFPEPAVDRDPSEGAAEEEPEAAAESAPSRAIGTRFRPVSALVPLEPDMAHWNGTAAPNVEAEAALLTSGVDEQQYTLPRSPAALGPSAAGIKALDGILHTDASAAIAGGGDEAPSREPGDVTEPTCTLFLPTAEDAGWTKASELNMHDGSVEIEPAAALGEPSDVAAAPVIADQLDRPFEPAGLFFEMSASDGYAGPQHEEDDEGDVAEAVAGSRHESPQGAA